MKNELRYFVTDIVAVPVIRIAKKSEAYKQVTKDGWGIVYTDQNETLICDEDSSAVLINQYGQQCCIFPYEELKPREWFKQAECQAIIQSDSCGFSFWEKEEGLVKLYVTYDENGFVDSYRITDWTEEPFDGEIEIMFEELPLTEAL
jgi:hypothetical protein